MALNLIPWMIALAVVDIVIPIPLTGLLVIYSLVKKPKWFRKLCAEIASETPAPPEP